MLRHSPTPRLAVSCWWVFHEAGKRQEILDQIRPVPRGLVDLDRHRKLLERIIPAPLYVTVDCVGRGDGKGILFIDVPAQPPTCLPYLVPGSARMGKDSQQAGIDQLLYQRLNAGVRRPDLYLFLHLDPAGQGPSRVPGQSCAPVGAAGAGLAAAPPCEDHTYLIANSHPPACMKERSGLAGETPGTWRP